MMLQGKKFKFGCWTINLNLEGKRVTPEDLSEATLHRIAERIKEGFYGGEIIEEVGEDDGRD